MYVRNVILLAPAADRLVDAAAVDRRLEQWFWTVATTPLVVGGESRKNREAVNLILTAGRGGKVSTFRVWMGGTDMVQHSDRFNYEKRGIDSSSRRDEMT